MHDILAIGWTWLNCLFKETWSQRKATVYSYASCARDNHNDNHNNHDNHDNYHDNYDNYHDNNHNNYDNFKNNFKNMAVWVVEFSSGGYKIRKIIEFWVLG